MKGHREQHLKINKIIITITEWTQLVFYCYAPEKNKNVKNVNIVKNNK